MKKFVIIAWFAVLISIILVGQLPSRAQEVIILNDDILEVALVDSMLTYGLSASADTSVTTHRVRALDGRGLKLLEDGGKGITITDVTGAITMDGGSLTLENTGDISIKYYDTTLGEAFMLSWDSSEGEFQVSLAATINTNNAIEVVVATGVITLPYGTLSLGVDDITDGVIVAYGDNATAGGILELYNPANEDGTGYQFHRLEATGATLSLGGDADPDIFTFHYDGSFLASKQLIVGSNALNLSGTINLISSGGDQANIDVNTSDQMRFVDASGGYIFATNSGSTLSLYHSGQVGEVELTTTSTGGLILIRGSTSSAAMLFDGRSTNASYILGRKFGIGTTTPTEELEVVGSVEFSNAGDITQRFYDTSLGEAMNLSWDASEGKFLISAAVTINTNNVIEITASTGVTVLPYGTLSLGSDALDNDGTLTLLDADGNSFSIIGGDDRIIFESSSGKSELHVDYITGAIAAGTEHSIIHINIEDATATGGLVHGIDVAKVGTGTVTVVGMGVFSGVKPIVQHTGTFVTPDKALKFYKLGAPTDTTNVTTAFGSTSVDSTLFNNDNDEVLLGAAAVFNEIEVILNTAAANPGIKPTFWYSSGGDGSWTQFFPEDGSNGMRDSGIIDWVSGDLSWTTWVLDSTDQYWIRIIRTQNSLSTIPIEDTFKILASTDYTWDENGDLSIKELTAPGGIITTLGSSDGIRLPGSGDLTDGQYAGTTMSVTSGYSSTAFADLVYLDDQSGVAKLEKTDSDAAASSADVMVGIALTVAAADAACIILVEGVITHDTWNWTVAGQSLWIDDETTGTAGLFIDNAPNGTNDIVRPVAWVIDDDTIYFHGGAAYVTIP